MTKERLFVKTCQKKFTKQLKLLGVGLAKKFQANHWLLANQSFTTNKITSPFNPFYGEGLLRQEEHLSGFNLKECFVSGWRGEALSNKTVMAITKHFENLRQDAKTSLLKNKDFPRSLKKMIYEDFLSYSEEKAILCYSINENNFFKELANDESEHHDELSKYVDIFSLRVASLYFYKLRFITLLSKYYFKKFDLKNAYNINSFFTTMFPKGGSKELTTSTFNSNIYSWYIPSDELEGSLSNLSSIILELNINEITKILSQKTEEYLGPTNSYSHSLSHKDFGLFLNTLLINYPKWKKEVDKESSDPLKDQCFGMDVVSTKFVGDYLESLSQSHWLAQETNSKIKWTEILCSDFKSKGFVNGEYMKLINELQFLTFLSTLAIEKGHDPTSFTSGVIKEHYFNKKRNLSHHSLLPISGISDGLSSYNSIVLNLSHAPKSNGQHHLISKITEQQRTLKPHGYLYVLSNTNLFISSQKDKIETLLSELRLETLIDLDGLRGKGELGSFLYIFKKRATKRNSSSKETFYNFRFTGELMSFRDIEVFTEYINRFFAENYNFAPAMYQKEMNKNFEFSFYQDAILGGRIILSHSKESNKITHPKFFKQLLNSCKPFDTFFSLTPLSSNENDPNGLYEFSHPHHVVVVNKTEPHQTKIEIIDYQYLEAKMYSYGVAQCFYFGISEKVIGASIELVKDFFDSPIGQQIIDLSFESDNKKIKQTLDKLLIPSYIATAKELPPSIREGLGFLNLKKEKILETHPIELQKRFQEVKLLLPSLVINYSKDTMSLLSSFNQALNECLFFLNLDKDSHAINFNNPMFHAPLLLVPKVSLYPDNQDIYVEFIGSKAINLLHSPLSSIKRKTISEGSKERACLDLFVGQEKIVSLHSEETMIIFLEFLLQNAVNHPISLVLQGAKVPTLKDLNSIIGSLNSISKTISDVSLDVKNMIQDFSNKLLLADNG